MLLSGLWSSFDAEHLITSEQITSDAFLLQWRKVRIHVQNVSPLLDSVLLLSYEDLSCLKPSIILFSVSMWKHWRFDQN